MSAPVACPHCGGVLQVVEGAVGQWMIAGYAVGGALVERISPAVFVACTGCEFCWPDLEDNERGSDEN